MRVWLFLAFAALAGCVTRVPLAKNYGGPEERPADLLALAGDYPAAPLVVDDEQARERRDFAVRHLSLPWSADFDREAIDFDYYDVDGDDRTPVIVLLPIFNGNLSITRFFARYFANQGWAAVVVDRGRDALDGLEAPEEAIRANLRDYRRVLDWVEQQPELDAARIGLMGISFGAMDAVMLTAIDERVDALVVAMAGGDLPSVLLSTEYRPVERTIDDLLVDRHMTRAALRDSLEESIDTDPLALAPYVDAERVLMIVTRTDAIVPFETQEALRESLGAPETLYLPTGHRPSVVFFPKLRSSAHEFFARQFALAQTALTAN